jgi:hypothetical protein
MDTENRATITCEEFAAEDEHTHVNIITAHISLSFKHTCTCTHYKTEALPLFRAFLTLYFNYSFLSICRTIIPLVLQEVLAHQDCSEVEKVSIMPLMSLTDYKEAVPPFIVFEVTGTRLIL